MISENDIKRDYATNKEVAELLGVNKTRVNQILTSGKLPGAFKFSDTWLIPRVAVENYRREKPGPKKYAEMKRENEELRALLEEALAANKREVNENEE